MAARRSFIFSMFATLLFACGPTVGPSLDTDETVVFFTREIRASANPGWFTVPIHGWVYEPAESRARRVAVETALESHFGLTTKPDTEANFSQRTNLFFGDNERGERVSIELAGTRFDLPPTDARGHVETEVRVPATVIEAARGRGAFLSFRVLSAPEGASISPGKALLPTSGPLTVISDIDDTVKISEVTNRKALLENTFFRDFRDVPGMAALYQTWAGQGVSFHFVSSSPWQLYPPLQAFLDRAGFPPAVLHLKTVRLRDESLLDLFAPGDQTKPRQIAPILARYPERRFVLIGDTGEQDPEVYAALLKKHPKRIARVFLRNVTNAAKEDGRFRRLFGEMAEDRWQLFTDPTTLVLPALR